MSTPADKECRRCVDTVWTERPHSLLRAAFAAVLTCLTASAEPKFQAEIEYVQAGGESLCLDATIPGGDGPFRLPSGPPAGFSRKLGYQTPDAGIRKIRASLGYPLEIPSRVAPVNRAKPLQSLLICHRPISRNLRRRRLLSKSWDGQEE